MELQFLVFFLVFAFSFMKLILYDDIYWKRGIYIIIFSLQYLQQQNTAKKGGKDLVMSSSSNLKCILMKKPDIFLR